MGLTLQDGCDRDLWLRGSGLDQQEVMWPPGDRQLWQTSLGGGGAGLEKEDMQFLDPSMDMAPARSTQRPALLGPRTKTPQLLAGLP